MKIIKVPILFSDLLELTRDSFGHFVKGVVDVRCELMILGGGLHADGEAILIEQGSMQEDLWGINIFPDRDRGEWIEFDSLINIRPRQNNFTRNIENSSLREKIISIVNKLICDDQMTGVLEDAGPYQRNMNTEFNNNTGSYIHKELAAGKWFELSLAEQMGNIGSEVYRAINHHRKQETVYFEKAFVRALELFDLTLADKRWRKKEIARSREVFCDLFYGGNVYKTDPDQFNQYFTDFALMARSERDKGGVK